MVGRIESERIEFKREYSEKALKGVISFANSSGGKLYIGIDDDGTMVGVVDPDEVGRSVVSGVSNGIFPDMVELISVSTMDCDGKSVVCVEVSEGSKKPYYWRSKGLREGGVFIRKGASSIPASESQILKMVREYSDKDYEEMVSLEQDLTFDYTSQYFADRGIEFGERQMMSLGMIDRGMYTNVAYFLSDQFSQGIKMAMYSDEYRTAFVDHDETRGSVLEQYDRACDFVERHNNRRAVIKGRFRQESRDYPVEAVREVIANALVHRDYEINGSTLVSMFEEEMWVSSVGGIVRGLGMDDIMLGTSSRRNEKLADVFQRLSIIENFGTGIPRIMGLYRDEAVKPRIEASTNVFKVTLPRMSVGTMSDDARRLVEAFSGRGTFTRAEAEKALDVSRSSAYAAISELIAIGKAEAVGSGRGTSYRLVR